MKTIKITGKSFSSLDKAKAQAYKQTDKRSRPHYIIEVILPWGDADYFVVDKDNWQRSGLSYVVSYHPVNSCVVCGNPTGNYYCDSCKGDVVNA